MSKDSEKFHENRYGVTMSKELIVKLHIISRLMVPAWSSELDSAWNKVALKCSISLEHNRMYLSLAKPPNNPGY